MVSWKEIFYNDVHPVPLLVEGYGEEAQIMGIYEEYKGWQKIWTG